MKLKTKIIILCIICVVAITSVLIINNKDKKTYFQEIKYTEVINKMDSKENFVLCISQTTCSHCQAYKPKLSKVANKYKLEIFYVEVDKLDAEEEKALKKYINYSSTPTTVFITNGAEKTVANRINGDTSSEKIIKKLKSNGFIK